MKHWQRVLGVFLVCISLEARGALCLGGIPEASPKALEGAAIVINIPSRTLAIRQEGKIIKTYPVGVGRPSFPSPIGSFEVLRMVKYPGWEHPYKPAGAVKISAKAKGNPLGTRWIGFKHYKSGEYGIHGTPNSKSVGRLSSHGCIRMRIHDAEDLFNRVQVGNPVVVTYDIFEVRQTQGKLYLIRYPDVYRKKPEALAAAQRAIQEKAPGFSLSPQRLNQLLQRSTLEKPIELGTLNPVSPLKDPASSEHRM